MKKLVKKITAGWSMKKRIGVVVFFLLLVIVGIVGIRTYGAAQQRKAMSARRGQVETVQIKKQNLIESISVTGTIASADAWDVSASAKNVKVLEVNYDVGDYVNEGDVIVVLDASDLELSLTQAQNTQALSNYKENQSIASAGTSYAQTVEDADYSY